MGALQVLARLTFDGHIPRAETTAFLARIERDNLIDDGDMTWWGWENAVTALGLTEIVHPLLSPLYALFDFFELPMQLVVEELTRMRASRF